MMVGGVTASIAILEMIKPVDLPKLIQEEVEGQDTKPDLQHRRALRWNRSASEIKNADIRKCLN